MKKASSKNQHFTFYPKNNTVGEKGEGVDPSSKSALQTSTIQEKRGNSKSFSTTKTAQLEERVGDSGFSYIPVSEQDVQEWVYIVFYM